MSSSVHTVHSGGDPVTAYEPVDYRGPPAEGRWHPVVNGTMTAHEKKAQEHQAQHQDPESAEANHGDRQPLLEDRPVVELLELQKRMFQST